MNIPLIVAAASAVALSASASAGWSQANDPTPIPVPSPLATYEVKGAIVPVLVVACEQIKGFNHSCDDAYVRGGSIIVHEYEKYYAVVVEPAGGPTLLQEHVIMIVDKAKLPH
ncbi:MAG TPA: hypothetical protein VFO25_09870 [Candidatus Eremiobacteraceae bacterium]|nr:hypothetical protein [Candidatus Eremiobacteraceae bacterium]